jgi:ribulose 1,5-bisphosphate synthetase/thiazole synthase
MTVIADVKEEAIIDEVSVTYMRTGAYLATVKTVEMIAKLVTYV